MTVKMETPDGSWLAYGTAPDSLLSEAQNLPIREDGKSPLVGQTVEFAAQFEAGRDPYFAMFKRPTKAGIVPASV